MITGNTRRRCLRLLSTSVLILAITTPYGRTQAQAGQSLQAFEQTLPGSVVKIHMTPIPGGKIKIRGREVEVKPFYFASTDTTWEAYDVFLNSGPPSKPYDQTKFGPDAIARPSKSYILPDLGWGHHGYPVINVSIDSVTMFSRWMASVTKKKYRLPTEAEWEFACREAQPDGWKLDKTKLAQVAWYAANSEGMTHPVAKKAPNKLGLFDMLGNVGNWATDLDGKPVLCGGSYMDAATLLSPDTRRKWSPAWQQEDPQIPKSRWWLSDGSFVGIRLVCEP
jgi:formylglycine-generating enzyme required for sulfatase activity